MTILVAVTEDAGGLAALQEAIAEGARRGDAVVALNLRATTLELPPGSGVRVVDRTAGVEDGDAVLEALDADPAVELLVIGVRRRSPVGKALLGDVAQRLLLEAEVPVLAVKASA